MSESMFWWRLGCYIERQQEVPDMATFGNSDSLPNSSTQAVVAVWSKLASAGHVLWRLAKISNLKILT
jgi:hypothetical protein